MPEASALRLFVAIQLPSAVLSALTQLQHRLQRDPALARLRWVRPDGIHLTLKFLGETPSPKVPEIETAVAAAVHGHRPFDLQTGKFGTFGSKQSPRVLWLDLDGDVAALSSLQREVEAELAKMGFEPEHRRFSPHLTLARVPPDRARDAAPALADAVASTQVDATTFRAETVSLMKSDLRPGGAIYTRLFGAPLR